MDVFDAAASPAAWSAGVGPTRDDLHGSLSSSSRQFADDSDEGGVLVLEPLVVGFQVSQNLQTENDKLMK